MVPRGTVVSAASWGGRKRKSRRQQRKLGVRSVSDKGREQIPSGYQESAAVGDEDGKHCGKALKTLKNLQGTGGQYPAVFQQPHVAVAPSGCHQWTQPRCLGTLVHAPHTYCQGWDLHVQGAPSQEQDGQVEQRCAGSRSRLCPSPDPTPPLPQPFPAAHPAPTVSIEDPGSAGQ